MNINNLSQTERLRRDVVVASLCAAEFGILTFAAFGGLAGWFRDVDAEVTFPLPVMPVSDEERANLLGLALGEMRAAVDKAAASGLDDEDTFAGLAPVVDPLWREIRSLHAEMINDAMPSAGGAGLSDGELDSAVEVTVEDRIAALEAITGVSRERIVAMGDDPAIKLMLDRLGLSIDDLG